MVNYASPERLRRHYDIEIALAARLRNSTAAERPELYATIYNELFSQVPELGAANDEDAHRYAEQNFKLVKRFLKPATVFLEIGAGNGELSRLVSPYVKKLIALEVSAETISRFAPPPNTTVVLSKGVDIPVDPESIDCAFSTQVLEHIHPDDALLHVSNVCKTLKTNGMYICKTPHRFSGPHDVSGFFDLEAQGLHLKEYTISEMIVLFKAGGFGTCRVLYGGKGFYLPFPLWLARAIEVCLKPVPLKIRRKIALFYPLRALFGITFVAVKTP
jgi:SAM-dependent methyltransferase